MNKLRIPLLVLVVIMAAFFLKGRIVHEKFDSTIWKTANLNLEENWSLRWDMMNDLRNKYKLVGMTKREIIDLLGEGGEPSSLEFTYYLGYSKRGINTGTLLITFNDEDIVTEVRVWQG